MKARIWTLTCAFFGFSTAALASNVDGVFLSHHEPLERLSVQTDGAGQSNKPQTIGPVELSFDALGRSFELQLQPNANLLAAMSKSRVGDDAVPYRGAIKGVPGSWVRIVMVDGLPAGMIWDGENLYAIEVPGDSIVDSAAPIAYRLADAIIAPGALSCASGVSATSGAAMYESLVGNLGAALAPGAISEINFGAIGDFEFTDPRGVANAELAIMTRLNNVDGIFSQQLGVQINVPLIETFTDINDPFSSSTDASTLLNELGAYRLATPAQSSQGLTHLFTGRVFNGSTVGVAFTNALCQPFAGAGLTQAGGGAALDSLVAAHEIGHNFGAPHDGVPGPCESETGAFLMATSVSGSDQFSACSVAQMQPNIAAASCITLLPSTDISIAFNEPDSTVLLSNVARFTLDLINNGTEVAENVIADITLPATVAFVDASGSGSTCTNGAGTVSCRLGDIAGSSGATIAVTTDTIAVGVGSFDATVTADADDRPGNNQDSVQLTVDPAVNLAIIALSSSPVIVDQTTMITATLDNLSMLDATGVTLSITLDSGLQADTASWSIGTCSVVSAQQVDCQTGQFDAQSSSSLSVGITGLTKGNQDFTVTLASVEADADMTNNSAAGTIRVNSESGGDEGGGRIGWLFLAILGWTALLRRGLSKDRLI